MPQKTSCDINPLLAAERKTSGEDGWRCQKSEGSSLSCHNQSINQSYSPQPQSVNQLRKKERHHVELSIVRILFPPVTINHWSLAGQTSNALSMENEGSARRQGTSVTDKEAVNASLRGFFGFSTTQVTSLQPAFKMDLCLPLSTYSVLSDQD